MRKLWPILLLGALSMLFAEIFSGASQTWYVHAWSLIVTFPLYLAHVLFFLWIAIKTKRTSLSQLYLFGVLFGLYESWITKVLWAGYMNSAGPGAGTLFGLGIFEVPILVFFWHPIMSFILPILIFELLSGKVLTNHESIFKKSKIKSIIIILFLILTSTFLVNGNKFNLLSANASFLGSMLIVLGLYKLSKGTDIRFFELKKKIFILVSLYLALLYVWAFIFLLPERIPKTLIPYISILILYIIPIILLRKSSKATIKLTKFKNNSYTSKDFIKFMTIFFIALNLACLIPKGSTIIFYFTYHIFNIIGVILFLKVSYGLLKTKNKKKK